MAIKIAGEMEKSLYNCTDLTRKEINKIARAAAGASSGTRDTFRQGLKETEPFFNGLEKAGEKAFQALTAAAAAAGTVITGIGAASAKAGLEFETAFAGVKKTTKATAEEYAAIRGEIVGMTREIPASGAEISAVAEAAGQLGIQKENLLSFTRTMVDLGNVANDLSSVDAATALAKFANITGLSADDYGRLGSTIVELGNNAATTESVIADMATRLASAGELAGFSEANIMAVATAISSVGIEADAGGSAMSKMIKKVQVAVETGNKSLKDYARVAGMSVSEFKDAFQKDGFSAVAAFIGGLNDVERNGKTATVILDEMGLTEIRLSNTLLSLANAGDVLPDAIEMANRAWEENTAITERAAQKYDTTENKMAIMKNGFTEMGIAIYDQFNGPMRDGVDIITELVHGATADISGSNVIRDLSRDAVNSLPTAVRAIKGAAEAVAMLADPFLSMGGWVARHPDLLATTIAGLGSAILTYKVINRVNALATAFTSLSAASLPILAITGIAAVIGGTALAVKKAAAEAKKASLDAHFGNITLSMQEMQDVAAYIVRNDSFGQLEEAVSQLGELEGINDSIERTVSELNRMNWKVSIGMELDGEEAGEYRQAIESYAADVQKYIEQEQYGINLSVGVLTGEELEDSDIVAQLNRFYDGKNAELARIGRDLNAAVTDAFADGLLDFDESEAIAKLQRQMADVKASLATGSYEAELDLLGLKYSAGELDAESFQNLMAEIEGKQDEARQKYDEAYVASKQALGSALEDKSITQEQYDIDVKELEKGYLEQIGSMDAKAADFLLETLIGQYGDEIGNRVTEMDASLGEILGERINRQEAGSGGKTAWDLEGIASDLGGPLGGADGDALEELWGQLAPVYGRLVGTYQQYVQTGEKAPVGLEEIVRKGAAVGVLAGDNGGIYPALGVAAGKYEDYGEAIKNFQQEEYYIPEQLAESIRGNTDTVDAAVGDIHTYTRRKLETEFQAPISVDMEVELNPDIKMDGLPLKTRLSTGGRLGIEGHADGGIVTAPTISWLAEGGYPESVIPLDGSRNAWNLWRKTGELLGTPDGSGSLKGLADRLAGGGTQGGTLNAMENREENNRFVFSPVLNIDGTGADTERIKDVIREMFGEFGDFVESVIDRKARDMERYNFY